jgi:hypothetical protein
MGLTGTLKMNNLLDIIGAFLLAGSIVLPFGFFFSYFWGSIMLKIKLTVSDKITLSGMYFDTKQNKQSINREFASEENAKDYVEVMRGNDCEFSLIVMRKV